MFDNFGLGEFFFLALLALLFFGPERLPQIGASLGRWVGKLTQYSKAFMTEWREEALVIHEAVEEVKGIRDEIVAAQAEISSTLETARTDVQGGVDAAKEAVTGAREDVVRRIEDQRQQAAADFEQVGQEQESAPPSTGSDDEAVEKTQAIVDNLMLKRREAELAADHDEEWLRNWRAIQETMDRNRRNKSTQSATYSPDREQESEAEATSESEIGEAAEAGVVPAAGPLAADAVEGEAGQGANAAPAEAEQVKESKESAFDRTQAILDNLRRKRGEPVPETAEAKAEEPETVEIEAEEAVIVEADAAPPAVEPETVVEKEPVRESAYDRTQKILDDLAAKRSKAKPQATIERAAEEEPAAAVGLAEEKPGAGREGTPAFDRQEFEQLSAQVIRLQDEMAALRQEMRDLLAVANQASASDSAADGLSVEEAA